MSRFSQVSVLLPCLAIGLAGMPRAAHASGPCDDLHERCTLRGCSVGKEKAACLKRCSDEKRACMAAQSTSPESEAAPQGKTCSLWKNVGGGVIQGTMCCSFNPFQQGARVGACSCSQAPSYCQ